MPHRIISTERDREILFRILSQQKLPMTVEWAQGRDRSLDQNHLQWMWAGEAAQQLGDQTAADVQNRWKLEIGVPILRADSQEFRETYDRCIKPLPYEQKLEAMKFIDVTSIMKVPQMIAYLDAIDRECAEMGIILTVPDPELVKYQARYRAKL